MIVSTRATGRMAALLAVLALLTGYVIAAAPAARAAGDLAITGSVTLPAGIDSSWLAEVRVRAYPDGSSTPVTVGVDEAGAYSVGGLGAGDYVIKVEVLPREDSATGQHVYPNVLAEYFQDSATFGASQLITLTDADATGIDVQLNAGNVVSGTVNLPDGAPQDWLEGVYIIAKSVSGSDSRQGTLNYETGAYEIAGMLPVAYTLSIQVSPYWDDALGGPVAPNLLNPTNKSVSLAGGDLAGVDWSLTTGLSLRGQITLPAGVDSSALAGLHIEALAYAGGRTYPGFITDEDGNYLVTGLTAGTYGVSVSAQDAPGTGGAGGTANLLDEYYANKRSTTDADPVQVIADVTGIDFALDAGAVITGDITGGVPGGTITPYGPNGEPLYGAGVAGVSGGSYTVSSLTDGTYRLWYHGWDEAADGPVDQWLVDADGHSTWTVTAGAVTAADLVVRPATAYIAGTLTISGFTGHPGASDPFPQRALAEVYLYSNMGGTWLKDPIPRTPKFFDNKAYEYAFDGLPAGDYRVGFEEAAKQYHGNGPLGQRWYNGKSTFAAADTITLADGEGREGIDGAVEPSGGDVFPFFVAPIPVVPGTPTVGTASVVSVGDWDPVPSTLTYQWFLDAAPIAGATTDSYTPTAANAGKALTVSVKAQRVGFTTTTRVSAAKTVVPGTLTATTPSLSGSGAVGTTLTADAGAWFPAGVTLAYQWLADGGEIGGATGTTHAVVAADVGKDFTVRVTGTLAGFATQSATSAPVTAIPGTLVSPTPTITGASSVGSTLTAVPGAWGPAGVALAYQWLADSAEISGAHAATYAVQAADLGKAITVRVTGTLAGYTTAAATSAATEVVGLAFAAAPTPTINGDILVGSEVNAVPGTWDPSPSLAYQWLRNGTPIAGATTQVYVLSEPDFGTTLSVRVTGTLVGYTTTARTSAGAAVPKGTLAAGTAPSITGTPAVGSTLTANPGTWTPTASASAYQWRVNGAAVTGATAATYVVRAGDVGKDITVDMTISLARYSDVEVTAPAVGAIKGTLVAPIPTITGGSAAGNTLTAVVGTWTPSATLTYRWYRNGAPISGAVKSTYKIVTADRGTKITVRVTGSKAGYDTLARTSAAKSIPKIFTKAPTPTISGTATVGKTLTVKVGTWSPTATKKYQWLRNGVAITGATGSTYKLKTADKGKKVSVRVTGSKTGYLTTAKTSASKTVS